MPKPSKTLLLMLMTLTALGEISTQLLIPALGELEQGFAACWDRPAEREQAERLMRRMQFLDKLALEVRELEERLDD